VSAGSPPRVRWRGSARAWLTAAGLSGALLVAACSTSGRPAPATSAARPARASSVLAAPAVRAADAPTLRILAAPYQLPSGVAREVVLPDGPDLLILGGLGQRSAATAAVRRLNPVTGGTTVAGRLIAPTHDAAGATLRGRDFLFGGGNPASVATVQELGRPKAATVAGRLPGPRSGLAAVTIGGTAYLLGGYDGAGYAADVLATTDGRAFHVVARLPVPVRYPAVAALGGQIWVFGGQASTGPTSDIQRVTLPAASQPSTSPPSTSPPSTGQPSTSRPSAGTATGRAVVVGRLPQPVTGASAFTLGGTLFVAGGQVSHRPGMVISGQVLSYHPGHPAVTVAGQLPVPVAGAGVAVTGGTAYLIGGNDGIRPVPAVTRIQLAPDPPASQAAGAPWLEPPRGGGHLAPGSNPAALPGDVLIADHRNNRLLIVDPQGRIRWQFPQPGDLASGQTFPVPDDAFFSPDGKDIVATEEDASVISVIDIARHRIVYRYGTPWQPGSSANHVSNPDDAMMLPSGSLITADIKNCRVLLIKPPAHHPQRIIGQPGYGCWHDPPYTFGSPNGAFPMTSGKYLVTEINGDWVNTLSLSGHLAWSANPPGVAYPSDSNEIYPGRYLTVDYSTAGQVVEFSATGQLLWRFRGLNHPSLALPLPNGDILVNDDFNDRVIVIDPVSNRIVWQYGHKGVPGTASGYLNDPDGVDLTPPNSLVITHAGTMGEP
jgi:hypothetical protein